MMRQAWHIFLKDTRQFRYWIAVVLFWTMMLVASSESWSERLSLPWNWQASVRLMLREYSAWVLPAGWWAVIALVVHAEALPGDRQFWVTRPYARRSLFLAKLLFVLVYIVVPTTVAHAAIVRMNDLPLLSSLPGLLWEQLLIGVIVLLPAAAVAALTSSLTQFLLAVMIAPVLALTSQFLPDWGGLGWIRHSVAILAIAAIGSAVLFLQFRYRRTFVARRIALVCLLVTAAVIPLLPLTTAFALQSRLGDAVDSRVTASLREDLGDQTRPGPYKGVNFRFNVAGLDEGTLLACEARSVVLDVPGGPRWETGVVRNRIEQVTIAPFACPTVVFLPEGFLDTAVGRTVKLRAVLYLTAFGPSQPTPVPVDAGPVLIPEGGVCAAGSVRDVIRLACLDAFRRPRSMAVRDGRVSAIASYSPFPAELRIRPVRGNDHYSRSADAIPVVITRDPAAHVRLVVERDVSLEAFTFQ